jgi:diguanylate cyclase (GGDEF)-like protein
MRLLIADDDIICRRNLEKLLGKWGHEVEVASDGTEAWQSLQRLDAPSMVVLDWMMPGMDGIEVCRRLRELKRDIRPYVILLSGKDQKKDLITGISGGADDYVTKPFAPEELRVRILAGERILNLQAESLTIMEALRKQATHDYLTGLPNRATIMEVLSREFARRSRGGQAVSVVLADVDHFKDVNDTFGHQVGDVVLAEIARRMAMEMRSYEHIGRYGGEEFLAVLWDCDTQSACVLAERLRRIVEGRPFDSPVGKIPVTMSLGVASTAEIPDATQETLVQLADAAMYRAKRAGRNRVECAMDASGVVLPP